MKPAGVWALALLVLGCSGDEHSAAPDHAEQDRRTRDAGALAPPGPGPNPMRRLTNYEYRNTLADLLGDVTLVEDATLSLLNEPESAGFRNDAEMLGISPLLAQTYLEVAVRVSQSVAETPGLVPCDVESVADTETCARSFVERFGKRVYRRPLERAERDAYAELYARAIIETGSFRSAIEWLSTAMLTSTPFLFRVELAPEGAPVTPVSGYEAASRLSYLLWQSMPDDELFEAAEQGQLDDPEQLASQAARMLGDPKAFRVYEFFEQWLDLDELRSITREPAHYPEFDANLIERLAAESKAFIIDILVHGGTFGDLVAGSFTFVDQALAEHYGLSQAPPGGEFQKVDAPGRSGILTQATLLVDDRPDRTSIVRRGVKVRTDLLCLPPPPPPADVDITLPMTDGTLSAQERLEQHRDDPTCAGCHALIDPIGVLFEAFDALGRPRTRDELGHPVRTRATVVGAGDVDGTYENLSEFASALSMSDTARDCFVQQAFRFFYGRKPTADDAGSIVTLRQSFAEHDYRLVDLIIGLSRTDHFLYKRVAEETAP